MLQNDQYVIIPVTIKKDNDSKYVHVHLGHFKEERKKIHGHYEVSLFEWSC